MVIDSSHLTFTPSEGEEGLITFLLWVEHFAGTSAPVNPQQPEVGCWSQPHFPDGDRGTERLHGWKMGEPGSAMLKSQGCILF